MAEKENGMKDMINIFIMDGKAYISYPEWGVYGCMADYRGNGNISIYPARQSLSKIRVFYVKDEKEIQEILAKEEL